MSGLKVLVLCGAISFLIGALAPAFYPPASPKNLGWLCLGLSFVTFAYFITVK